MILSTVLVLVVVAAAFKRLFSSFAMSFRPFLWRDIEPFANGQMMRSDMTANCVVFLIS